MDKKEAEEIKQQYLLEMILEEGFLLEQQSKLPTDHPTDGESLMYEVLSDLIAELRARIQKVKDTSLEQIAVDFDKNTYDYDGF